MKPSSYCGPAAGKSGLGPVVLAANVGSALPGLAAVAAVPLGAAVGAAGATAPHATNNGRAAPPAAVTISLRRLRWKSLLGMGAPRHRDLRVIVGEESTGAFDRGAGPLVSGVARVLGGGPFQAEGNVGWQGVEQRGDVGVAVTGAQATSAVAFDVV